jgi:hypothetical protein
MSLLIEVIGIYRGRELGVSSRPKKIVFIWTCDYFNGYRNPLLLPAIVVKAAAG